VLNDGQFFMCGAAGGFKLAPCITVKSTEIGMRLGFL
jgi:hypothetical protein